MKRSKRAFFMMMLVGVLTLSFVLPASAADIPKESYTYSLSKKSGEVSETLTIEDDGEVYEDLEVTSTIVPADAVLTFKAKVDFSVVLLGYSIKDGILITEQLPWSNNGKQTVEESLPANATATVSFNSGLAYYEFFVLDEKNDATSSFFFKVDKGTVSTDQPDAWAKAEVEEAIAAGLVPASLQSGYKQKITRADFAKIIIKLLEVQTGQTIDEILADNEVSLSDNPFTDTSVKEVIAANLMGIVNGKGNGKFDPSGSITRQEAAVMLTNTAEVLGYDVLTDASKFADDSSIASWAKTSVDFVSMFEIMNGTGNNTFSPKGTYTRQQAFMTITRLNNALQ